MLQQGGPVSSYLGQTPELLFIDKPDKPSFALGYFTSQRNFLALIFCPVAVLLL